MSLVSTYVQATDGQLYKNPDIRGDDFFLCFDDDDPPELVIKMKHPLKRSNDDLIARAKEILKENNINAEFVGEPMVGAERCFSLTNLNMHPAWSIFLEIKSAIPVKAISGHEGIKGDKVVCGVIYKWE